MKRKIDMLRDKRYEVQLMVDAANIDLPIILPDVEVWMKRVGESEIWAYQILNDKKRLGIWCLNLTSLYRLNTKAKKITRDIVELWEKGKINQGIVGDLMNEEGRAHPWLPLSVEVHIPPITAETLVVDAISRPLQLCRSFTFAEMQSATRYFNDAFLIGKGGFGKVYKGIIDNGVTMVAIKRLNPTSNHGGIDFRTEIGMLSVFRHCNLVSLIGYCEDVGEMILIYEYMLNGSLADHLHPKDGDRKGSSSILSWEQRLKICVGAARGIHYLHTGTGVLQSIIHRDVKTSNILLDENWAPKVSDFGLCKVGPANQSCTHISTRVKGTPGYCDPDYFLTHRLTKKSDVYAFGVVLFEVLSGKPALDFSLPKEQRSLATSARQSIEENTPHRLIDPNLKWEISSNSLKAFVEIAGQCLQNDSKKRPKMVEVVASLELALTLQRNKISSAVGDEIFDFCEAYDVDDNGLQIPGGGVIDNNYKESTETEEKVEKKVGTETNNDDDVGTSKINISENRLCKSCGKVEACVLLLPCKHLCVCTTCDSSLKACPVCNSTKNASASINRFS